MLRLNSSPCRCRSELLQQTIPGPRKEGTYRPVIDVSPFNRFVENFHFQMENISCLKTLLRRGDFITCIDLKDAYLFVHIQYTIPHKSTCVFYGETDVMHFKACHLG